MKNKVVVIMGSTSDEKFVGGIRKNLENASLPYEVAIASAHRTPKHLQTLLDIYGNSNDQIVYITVAGMSDALTGTVAARRIYPVIACPPDYDKHGEKKVFSSTCLPLPKGAEAKFARTPEEAVQMVQEELHSFDFSKKQELRREAYEKGIQTVLADSQLRGAKHPLPMTLWKIGKVREIYDLGRELLINSTDKISAFDVVSVTEIPNKGFSLNQLSAWWFRQTDDIFPNHYISTPDTTMMLAKKAERIDIEWILRSRLYGSMYRDYEKGKREFWGVKLPDGMQRAEELPQVMLTPTTKAEEGHDKSITREEAVNVGLVTLDEWKAAEEGVLKLFEYYQKVAKQVGIIIPDFKIEIGRYKGYLMQIDEAPTNDSARFWLEKKLVIGKKQEGHCLDKEYYRQFLIESGVDPDNPPRPLSRIPKIVVDEVGKRAMGSYEVLTKKKSSDNLNLRDLGEVVQELYGTSED